MSKDYPDIAAGQEVVIDPQRQDLKFACCDCNLVHRLRFEIRNDGKLIVRAWRDNRATGQLRRWRGI